MDHAPAGLSSRGPRVQVLLSSYNGASFLEQQIDSILAQRDVEVRLLVRDDGSSDTTHDILARYAAADPRVEVLSGCNLGVVASFFELLRIADSGFDVTCFADQDDWWFPAKLARAASALATRPAGTPAGYCARVTLADANLNRMRDGPHWPRGLGFGNALVENIAIGCTLAMNEAARRLLLAPGPPRSAQMHDWIVYQVISACGHMIYDPEMVLLYRQHDSNVIGTAGSRPARLVNTARRMLRTDAAARVIAQNRELRRCYGELLPRDAAELLETFLERPNGRLALAFDRRIWRQSRLDDLAMRALIAAGRL